MKLIQALIASCISAFIMIVLKKKANLFLMRFFRNLSRHKSRKRLYGNEAALIPILLGREKPVKNPIDELDPNTLDKWTLAEIAERDGRTESTPIFIGNSLLPLFFFNFKIKEISNSNNKIYYKNIYQM